ncbi:MAG: HEAT repeat domain-containing protein [Chloroflexi bacterium]|nr:HEAT repeat domain-containing protein [Chloroflexota bacterium]
MTRKKELFFDFKAALSHLKSDGDTLSPAALNALSGVNRQELAEFAETWVALPVERRRRASQMMVDLAEENFKNDFDLIFRYLLDDEDAAVRVHAIDGLWEDEDAALVKPLIGFLRSDPDPRVRAAAADSLGRFVLLAEYDRLPQGPSAQLVRDALLSTIRSGSEATPVRAHAIESLAYWSDEVMRNIITAAYDDEDEEMRASAVSAMGRSADTYWRQTAALELESPDPRMRFEAARAAGELENRAAVPRLIELMADADREVQGAAVTALGQIGGRPAREALTAAAQSDDEMVRTLADEALQELDFASNSDLLLLDIDSDGLALDDEEWDAVSEVDDKDSEE